MRVPPPVPSDSQPVTPRELAATQIGESLNAAPAVAGSELPSGMAVGEYKIERKIGEGGMATVYAAVHPLIGKKAAIKVMSSDLGADAMAVERFIQEARAVNQIGHPNIVDIFSFGKLRDGRNYFVMEWLQGETLHARMMRGRMSLIEATDILFHICDALEAAHEKGIVHRDLKPENIFLVEMRSNRKQVKLLDFGIAKLTGQGQSGKVLSTSANVVMGTPQYISPEQARAKNVDHRTDIYSLGALAYEMFLGRPPFYSDSVMAVVAMHLSDPVPPPKSLWPEVPPAIDAMLLGMLEKEPDKRPTMLNIRECLAEVREQYGRRDGDSGPIKHTLLYGEPPRTPTRSAPHPLVTPVPEGTPQPVVTDGSEIELEPIGAGRSRWLIMGGSIGVVAVLAVIFLFGRSPAKLPSPPPAPVVAAPLPAPKPAPAPTPAPVAPAVVVINVNVDDARIELDGKVVAESARNARLEMPPGGDHEIVVAAAGRKSFKKTFNLSSGAILEVPVTLRSASSSSSSPSRPGKPGKTKPGKNDDGFHMLDPFAK